MNPELLPTTSRRPRRHPLRAAIVTLLFTWFAPTAALAQDATDQSRAGIDGPYVRRTTDGSLTSTRIVADQSDALRTETTTLPADAPSFELELLPKVPPLRVTIRAPAEPPPCRRPRPDQLFVLSDIEGNLPALLGLLRAGGVIDERCHWTFGKGHLVFLGDLFDRGLQVTECLWLLYELEARARAGGGELHFVLGNHEVMNFTGDVRYVRRKYHENAARLGTTPDQLHARDTVLGQWLRTRPVALQLGDELFVHGGMSPAVVAAGLQIERLNAALHTALAGDGKAEPVDRALELAAGSADGLIWYRGYLQAPVVGDAELDAIRKHFGVARIVVGHTLVANIGFVLGRRVLAVDVQHAKGNSQAALRIGDDWYRLGLDGVRTRL
ncbi:MAG: metallophosphoesterase [Planctomycetes bacterium]|nr:metallophosphoesterase [Planctomycetota bacterium]